MPRKPTCLPGAAILHAMFSLTDDGRLINLKSRTSRKAGTFADVHMRWGYRSVFVDGRLHFAHRIIWVMSYGEEPKEFLDHINGDIFDNRVVNLRDVTHSQNMINRKKHKNNTSGVKGVHRRRDNGMWRAYLSKDGKRTHLGQFPTKEEAQTALDRIRDVMHGEFARAA